jgi:hypothetical protein
MRYKNNVLQILDNVDATVLKVQFGINRGGTQDQILNTIDELKAKLEELRGMIGVEPDDFEKQFAPNSQ